MKSATPMSRRYSPLRTMYLTGAAAAMPESFAKDISERILNKFAEAMSGTTQAAKEGAFAYVRLGALEDIFEDAELDHFFRVMPIVVLVSHEVRELNAKEYISPEHGLTPEAEQYFENKPKYTPSITYRIIGSDSEMKEGMFKYIIKDEVGNDSAIIDVVANLDGANNHFTMLPWGEETHVGIDSSMNLVIQSRRSRSAPWVKKFES